MPMFRLLFTLAYAIFLCILLFKHMLRGCVMINYYSDICHFHLLLHDNLLLAQRMFKPISGRMQIQAHMGIYVNA